MVTYIQTSVLNLLLCATVCVQAGISHIEHEEQLALEDRRQHLLTSQLKRLLGLTPEVTSEGDRFEETVQYRLDQLGQDTDVTVDTARRLVDVLATALGVDRDTFTSQVLNGVLDLLQGKNIDTAALEALETKLDTSKYEIQDEDSEEAETRQVSEGRDRILSYMDALDDITTIVQALLASIENVVGQMNIKGTTTTQPPIQTTQSETTPNWQSETTSQADTTVLAETTQSGTTQAETTWSETSESATTATETTQSWTTQAETTHSWTTQAETTQSETSVSAETTQSWTTQTETAPDETTQSQAAVTETTQGETTVVPGEVTTAEQEQTTAATDSGVAGETTTVTETGASQETTTAIETGVVTDQTTLATDTAAPGEITTFVAPTGVAGDMATTTSLAERGLGQADAIRLDNLELQLLEDIEKKRAARRLLTLIRSQLKQK